MPTIPLKDGFGLNVSVTPDPGALLKYFKSLPGFNITKINVRQIAKTTLKNSTADLSFTAGLNFDKTIEIGAGGDGLDVAASLNGTLALFVPPAGGGPLFDPDVFGDNIKVANNQRYASMALRATLNPDLTVPKGDLTFGFNAQSAVNLTYYQLFTADDTTVIDALTKTIAHFSIPGDLEDIDVMPEGSIAAVDGSGQFTFSGSVNLLAVTNPLASASLPKVGTLGVTGGASVTVGASYTYTGDYQVRVDRLAGKAFHLGFYKKLTSDFTLTASAGASVTATIGTSSDDLLVKLIHAISTNPAADVKALQQAGLSATEIQGMQSAVKSAVDRSLAIGATLELEGTATSDAMFLYAVDLKTVTADGRAMLHSALKGDLTPLVSADGDLPAGIKILKSAISKSRTMQHSLKINLLGIYNFLQLSSLMVKGIAAWDATTGELILTDQITAAKFGVSTSNLQANTRQLRKVMAQQFLITAAYRSVGKVVESGPALTAQQSYFEMQQSASSVQVRNDLLTAAVLGFESTTDALNKLPAGISHFGTETIYAEASYNDAAFRSLFLTNGKLRDANDYIAAGKKAITMIVQPGDPDAYRLLLVTKEGLYEELSQNGDTGSIEFKQMLIAAGVPKAMTAVAATDYTLIAWLAHAMSSTGEKLRAIDQFLLENPKTDPGNLEFLQLKNALANQVGKVAQLATDSFGGPWGFNTMALLRSSSAQKWFLVNAHVSGTFESAKTTAA